jgi:CubicO group peptidase (beta-lactamase class C family)
MTFPLHALRAQKTASFADSVRRAYQIPELSYAVVNMTEILEMSTSGQHAIHLPDTACLNDRFHIGSNTKAMTAFMAARYVELGKLKWTTRFFELFPEWEKDSKPAYSSITLQDLLSHRAGIQPLDGENEPALPHFKGTAQEKRWQFGRYVLTLDAVKMDSTMPFIYSNPGYTLASMMLEKVSKKSWEQLVEKILNKDLKLNIQSSWPENQLRKDTWGHFYENGNLNPVASTEGPMLEYTEPAGDLNIRLIDYIRFIQLNLQGLSGKNNYLKASTYNFLHRGVSNYAMGWYNIYDGEHEISSHAGTVLTYYSIVQVDRVRLRAYIIFTNAFSESTVEGVRILMRRLKEKYGS